MSEGIEIGAKVRNKLTHIEGIVCIRSEYLAGYTWLWVQPGLKEDDPTKEPPLVGGDVCEWEDLGESFKRPENTAGDPPRFELGSRVRDKVTGFTGIVNSRDEHLNHCWAYGVQSETLNKDSGATGALETFQSPRLLLVDDGLNAVSLPKPKKILARKTGATPGNILRKGM